MTLLKFIEVLEEPETEEYCEEASISSSSDEMCEDSERGSWIDCTFTYSPATYLSCPAGDTTTVNASISSSSDGIYEDPGRGGPRLDVTFTCTTPFAPAPVFFSTPAVATPASMTSSIVNESEIEVREFEKLFCRNLGNDTWQLVPDSKFCTPINQESVILFDFERMDESTEDDDVFAQSLELPVPEWRFLGTCGSTSIYPQSCKDDVRPRREYNDQEMIKWVGKIFKPSKCFDGDATFLKKN